VNLQKRGFNVMWTMSNIEAELFVALVIAMVAAAMVVAF
jgi:hypothetical protein